MSAPLVSRPGLRGAKKEGYDANGLVDLHVAAGFDRRGLLYPDTGGRTPRHQDELLAIRNDVYPRVQAQLELMKGDIEATLTPAQAEEFRKRFEALMRSLLPRPQQQ